MKKTLIIGLSIYAVGFTIVHIILWNCGNYRTIFVDYYIESEIDYAGYPTDGPPAAVVYVWAETEIIESFYADIKDDSTMIRIQEKAVRYVDMLRKNE